MRTVRRLRHHSDTTNISVHCLTVSWISCSRCQRCHRRSLFNQFTVRCEIYFSYYVIYNMIILQRNGGLFNIDDGTTRQCGWCQHGGHFDRDSLQVNIFNGWHYSYLYVLCLLLQFNFVYNVLICLSMLQNSPLEISKFIVY